MCNLFRFLLLVSCFIYKTVIIRVILLLMLWLTGKTFIKVIEITLAMFFVNGFEELKSYICPNKYFLLRLVSLHSDFIVKL